jgi:hypothetical protein
MRPVAILIFLLWAAPAWSRQGQPDGPAPFAQCEAAIAAAEQAQALPQGLLGAIARVETGRFDPSLGLVRPWPWSINAAGIGQVFDSKQAAVDAVRQLQDSGVRSIDVGCLQVNLMHHPFAFASLDQAFDPAANAAYAARFLRALYSESQDWTEAAAAYHSRTQDIAAAYRRNVLAAWGMGAVLPGPRRDFAGLGHMLPAGPAPPLRPFAPPTLPGSTADASAVLPDGAVRLLAQTEDCAVVQPSGGGSVWMARTRTAGCGRSPFASASHLRTILAPR